MRIREGFLWEVVSQESFEGPVSKWAAKGRQGHMGVGGAVCAKL